MKRTGIFGLCALLAGTSLISTTAACAGETSPATSAAANANAAVAAQPAAPKTPHYELSDYRNFFGMGWSADSNSDLLAYARQMGYTHMMYKYGMEKNPPQRE